MQNFKVVKSERVFDPDTGEMKYHDTIERLPQELIGVWDPNRKDKSYKYIKMKNSLDVKKKISELTTNEKAFMLSIMPYLDWETNILVGDGRTAGSKNHPLKWRDIDKITGFEQRTRRKIVESLVAKNILNYISGDYKKGIVINPQYALNGKTPSQVLINTFLVKEPLNDFYIT